MAMQKINIGTVADDGTGDPIRTAFDKANDNFQERRVDCSDAGGVYGTLTGAINGSNQVFTVAAGSYVAGTLMVYWNGILQGGSNVTETTPGSGIFTVGFTAQTGQIIMVTYKEQL